MRVFVLLQHSCQWVHGVKWGKATKQQRAFELVQKPS